MLELVLYPLEGVDALLAEFRIGGQLKGLLHLLIFCPTVGAFRQMVGYDLGRFFTDHTVRIEGQQVFDSVTGCLFHVPSPPNVL